MVPEVGAFGKHIALIGFMGAGKSTIGEEVAGMTLRRFIDTDAELERRYGSIDELFDRGEPEFRRLEEEVVAEAFAGSEPAVIALGGGAPASERVQSLLLQRAFTVWIQVDPDEAWQRVAGSGRPLARDERRFRKLYDERKAIYQSVAGAEADDAEEVLLAALGIVVARGLLGFPFFAQLLEGRRTALVADERVLGLHRPQVDASVHTVPSGEGAKALDVVDRLWGELELDLEGWIVGFGGGSTTDVAGFVAATYLRGVDWVAVPTTLVGQIDAAIGGKTAINLPAGKNLAGAFHYPQHVLVDTDLLSTLPERERRAGMAEAVKTGLLAGRELWTLPDDELVRACAAFKASVCLIDPYDEGEWRWSLNLGHTFAHALETGSDYAIGHGDAVALGLLAALRLSGRPTDIVDEVLAPQPVRADRERAWNALRRDKKARAGELWLVLLDDKGARLEAVPEGDVRRALDELIAD